MHPDQQKQGQNQEKQKPNLSIKKQTVAGFVIFRRTVDGIKFLLLYRRGNYWNFPKGHFEEGENSFEAALREVKEETGIAPVELHIIPKFRTHLNYNFRIGSEHIFDTVILYLAETKKEQVVIAPREHSGYAWFLYPDAVKVLGSKYAGTRRVLKEAHDFIRRKSGRRRPPHPARRGPHVPGDRKGGR